MASSHAGGVVDITVASVMSLQRDQRLQKYNAKKFKLVLAEILLRTRHCLMDYGTLQ